MTIEIVKYNKDTAIITALDEKYKGITIRPDNKDDYSIVMMGLKEYRDHRTAVTNWHRQGKAGIIEAGKRYDAEKNKWIALISEREDELKATRKAEDDRLDAIENQRIDDIKAMIDDIKRMEYNLSDKTQPELETIKQAVELLVFDEDDYQEFLADAQAAAFNAMAGIRFAIKTRAKLDEEEVVRNAKNDRLEKIRKEQDLAQAKIAEAQKKIDDANRELEKKKADFDRAEWEKGAKDRAEKAAKEKLEREAEEAEREKALDAEIVRAKEERTPDRDKLIVLADILDGLVPPKFKDEACEAICNDAMKSVQQISTDIRKKVEDLS